LGVSHIVEVADAAAFGDEFPPIAFADRLNEIYNGHVMQQQRDTHQRRLSGPAVAMVELFWPRPIARTPIVPERRWSHGHCQLTAWALAVGAAEVGAYARRATSRPGQLSPTRPPRCRASASQTAGAA
jgi:hypothetical protein